MLSASPEDQRYMSPKLQSKNQSRSVLVGKTSAVRAPRDLKQKLHAQC